ncbi:MliC family protein [Pelagibacterium xiamenense]|uniref:MliC family protein n=1 Tax=Pelagibacterium xiamenense TaxID=2901140 RepID=UPI001E58D8C2|nr:MliC family protein [Pelagibacterium xiamenense]MCD7058708.1 MliC family protein [Pelagibacterium xiamenense]
MTFKTLALAAAATLMATPVFAVDTSMQLVLELEGNAQRDVVRYTCDGLEETLTVEYVNAHPIFLALVPIEGEKLIFVNVISGSGARYASGQYVWWTTGNEAQLIDEMAEEDAEPASCIAATDTP